MESHTERTFRIGSYFRVQTNGCHSASQKTAGSALPSRGGGIAAHRLFIVQA
jgi:hypothetical protein